MIKWTYEKCKEVALGCETLKIFRHSFGRAYVVAKQHDWIKDICQHMGKTERITRWTIKNSYVEALKFSNRSGFADKSSRAYEILRKNKKLDDACKHMNKPYESNFKWNKEMCQKIALNYKYRMEFQVGDKKAYEAAKNNGWLNDICTHMIFKKLPSGHWNNIENCRLIASKYNTKTEFFKFSPHVYTKSLKFGWLDEICKHMIPCGSKYYRCVYSYEFSDNHVYVGLTYNLFRRNSNRCNDLNDTVTIYKNVSGLTPIIKQLTDYIPVKEAIEQEGKLLEKYIKEGWIKLNRCKTGGIGNYSKDVL